MNNWRKVSDITIYNGKGITPKYVDKSSIIVLNQKCVRNNKVDYSFAQYTDDTKNYNEDKYLKIGDVLVNSTGQGTAGRVAMINFIPEGKKLIVDSHILVLRTKNFYESKCLNYALFSIEHILQTYIDGSTGQGEFDRIRLFNIQVNYPKDELTQRKIATVLSALDDKIELNNRINAELEQMAKTLYDYWFVQFGFPDTNGKPYKSSGGKMVYNEVLKREIPEGWEVKKLGNLFSISNETINPQDYPNKVFKHYSIPIWDATKSYAEELGNTIHSNKFIVRKGNILVSKLNPWFNRVVYNSDESDIICSTEFVILQTKSEEEKAFLNQIVTNEKFIGYCVLNATGTSNSHKRVNPQNLIDYQIPVNEGVSTLFGKRVYPILEKIKSNQKQNQQLAALRDWLLPMLMNGQVKVGATKKEYNLGKEPSQMAAEPEVNYGKTAFDIPENRKVFAKQVLAGKIVSKFKDDPNFTDIKFQKIQFLAEHIIEADLKLNYYYQTAGPYDNVFMHTIYDNFRKLKWFDCQNKHFVPLEKQGKIDDYYHGYFALAQNQLDQLFNLLYQTTEAEAEIIATIYAVWNNRIIEKRTVTDTELFQDFYKWSDRKQQYSEAQIQEGLQWLRRNKMEPKGFGKLIKKVKGKK